MLSCQISFMLFWTNHICESTMLFMSLDPCTGYQRQFQLLSHLNNAARQYLILQNSTSSQFVQKVNIRTLQPLQPRPKHLLSNRSRSTRLQQSVNIPSAHKHLMQPDWLKSSNPSNHMFVTTFNKLCNATSPIRQATHQDADSTNVFPSSTGTQCNGDHFFLRRVDRSRWISVATHLFQLAQNNFMAILIIYYFQQF